MSQLGSPALVQSKTHVTTFAHAPKNARERANMVALARQVNCCTRVAMGVT